MKQFQVQMWLETPDLSTRNWKVYPFHHSMNCLRCSRFHCFPLPQPTKSSRRPTQSLAKSFRKYVAVFPSTVQSRTDKKRNKWANKRFRGQIQRTVLNEHKSRLLSQPIEHTILKWANPRERFNFNTGYEIISKPSTERLSFSCWRFWIKKLTRYFDLPETERSKTTQSKLQNAQQRDITLCVDLSCSVSLLQINCAADVMNY